MSSIKQYPWWAQCILLWFAVFILLNGIGLIGARFTDSTDTHWDTIDHKIPGIWNRWDAGYYLGIASDGYYRHPILAGFFPLYPMLMNMVYRLTGISMEATGWIISNISFLLSTLVFYQIARVIKNDHMFALRSVIAMLVFPTSFFYSAIYAESLYLLLVLLGIYLILRDHQLLIGGGLLLGISSLARPVGWLADIVILSEFIRRRKFDIKSLLSLGVALFFSILGIVFYIYYLYLILGTFTAIPDAQSHWPRHWDAPWNTYWVGLKHLIDFALLRENWFAYTMNVTDLFFTSFAGGVIVISFFWALRGEYPWSLAVYAAFLLLFFLSSQNEQPVPLWGMTRWVGSLFPMYFVLGNMFKTKQIQILYYLGSFGVLLFFTAWWTSGRWIG